MSIFRRRLFLIRKQQEEEIPLTFQVMPMVSQENELSQKFSYIASGNYSAESGVKYFQFDTTLIDYIDITDTLVEGDNIGGLYKENSELETVCYFIGSGSSNTVTNFDNLSTIIVPNTYKGKPISGVLANAFYQDSNLVSLSLNDVITEINADNFALNCSNLKSVYFGENFNNIGVLSTVFSPFNGCSNIEEIKVSENNRTFDTRENCNALIKKDTNTLYFGCKNTIIPSTEITIGAHSFMPTGYAGAYTPEKSLIIPNHAKIIDNSFYYAGFTNITIPGIFETIPNSCFYSARITNLFLPDGVKILEQWSFRAISATEINIAKTVTNIKEGAFYGTSSLKKLIFNHTANDPISIQAHSGNMNGAFYTKTARAVDIYTDKPSIKNYDWSANGVTATFYHLDGTLWE